MSTEAEFWGRDMAPRPSPAEALERAAAAVAEAAWNTAQPPKSRSMWKDIPASTRAALIRDAKHGLAAFSGLAREIRDSALVGARGAL